MPDDLTLPGTIPGLLRRGSPAIRLPLTPMGGAVVDRDGWPCIVVECGDEVAACAFSDGGISVVEDDIPLADLALDLSDATGRAHAAWWARHEFDKLFADLNRLSDKARRVLDLATRGEDMTPEQVADLRDFALHVAGVPS